MLGEFFVASRDDVGDFVEEGPSERVATVEAKGLSEVSLATLGEILGVGGYDALVDRIGDGFDAESGEAGVLPIPPDLTAALANLETVDAVAAAWAATEELTADLLTAEDTAVVLRDVGALARQAADGGGSLWYWWSL